MPLVLYATLGSSLPDGTAAAAPLWGAAQRVAKTQGEAVRRALGADEHLASAALGHALFQKLVSARSGMAFSTHTDPWSLIEHGDGRIRLDVPVLLESLASLEQQHPVPDKQWPFVLSAGQRRLQNANQIFRDPAFRRSDPDGALQIHPDDLSALGAVEGDWLAVESTRGRLVVRSKHDQGLRRGYVVLPHGYGQAYPNAQGVRVTAGPQINLLTDSAWRDPIAGTPYHKHVPVRIIQASAPEATQAEAQSRQIRQTAIG
jgi:anaerobic selenocysteine-containing dehydrogenase